MYNTFGRIPLKVRIFLAKTIFKNNNKVKDWFIRMQIGEIEDKERARGWWNDHYLPPHDPSDTLGEVLRWFRKNDITYSQTVPTSKLFDEGDLEITGVWNDASYPSLPIRAITQTSWIWSTHHEGGYWITFGKSKR